MHIDHDHLNLRNESDVEQKVIAPLLEESIYLDIPRDKIFPKQYLAPTELDKAAGKNRGYYPDYTVWMRGFPVLVIEAKDPEVPPEIGYREASLYARHLNQSYPTNLNPCRFIIATNGYFLLFGYWDCPPVLQQTVKNLRLGSKELEQLQQHCHARVLEAHAAEFLKKVKAEHSVCPYTLAGDQPVLNAPKAPNSFAAELSPILVRYFSSANEETNREIIERGYVSSEEVTEYDRILEALLRERLIRSDAVVQELEPGRYGEMHVAKAISEFGETHPQSGQLQIIQGAVGAGKSLFTRRYKVVLQPIDSAAHTRWSFIDFNAGPTDLTNAERWLCKRFVEGFESENPEFDLTSERVLRGIFCRNIQKRHAIYEQIDRASPQDGAVARSKDLSQWQDDPEEMARGIANYVLGVRREVLVVVMDNVDRLDLKNQLAAFQLALWFMHLTKSFVVLQMRDETYDRFKNQPPLDTFRTGIAFHISPPRFVDVVKRRLELSLEYLAAHAQDSQTYTVESGMRIKYPKSELGTFLRELYIEIFDRKRNISRVLEALAGRDVRRALEMFVSIITSGHLSERAITSTVMGAKGVPLTERVILRTLMRTTYRLFSDRSPFVFNVFTFNPNWQKPDNFLLIEILYFLARNRKRKGEIGIEGYFSCRRIADHLQRLGYVREDVMAGLNILLHRQLIAADHMNFREVGLDDCVRILASGWMHVRILTGRTEYLCGVIPTTPITDRDTAYRLADFVKIESARGDLAPFQRIRAVEIFREYLTTQFRSNTTPFVIPNDSGAQYVLKHIDGAIEHDTNVHVNIPSQADVLDA